MKAADAVDSLAKLSLSSQCLPTGHGNRWSRTSIKARACDKMVLAWAHIYLLAVYGRFCQEETPLRAN
jgi:hypothetical protein